ncbi:MAG TPA: alpha-galactosidase [Planctomycetota bacterium]|nr:alpha-galactosidase [Planctomycetota bacterium]OQC19758.1 MAG: Alpha-galactosidase [Planctomycetes bacterium ADurb.Bin069]HNR97730.1 alpha-galactosidase [Planctomycetota bacterium]HNU24803.1 alpha-galactosidase [Planctomycetota bacterium]HOE30899.1 alpha-galactosidase [Planctomycetota bacterium]
MRSIRLGLMGGLSLAAAVGAVEVLPEEVAEARCWARAKFMGIETPQEYTTGLNILTAFCPIGRNRQGDLPLKLGERVYQQGVFLHAPTKIVVRLPGPGQTFRARVGVTTNHMTAPGRGSVICSVTVGGEEKFRSGVLREGMPGEDVEVDLAGAAEFVIETSDAGDGVACDQSLWGDARAVLENGATVMLGDLPARWSGRVHTTEPPFSFLCDGRPSSEFLKTCSVVRGSDEVVAQRNEYTFTLVYTDPATNLTVRSEAIVYPGFPTVEWTLTFSNDGASDSPLISDIRSLDFRIERATQEGGFTLHHHTGSICAPNDYQPHATRLAPGAVKRIATSGGRPTNSDLPFFNVEADGEGLIAAIGWPGQWAAEFACDEGRGLRVSGGQELTRFRLRPGEKVRAPLSVVQFWKGDRVRSQNVWRKWMLEHNTPRPGGKPMPPILIMCTSDFYPGMMSNAADEMRYADAYAGAGVKLDYWWIDAGWYPCDGTGWPKVGTWEPDPVRYPRGIREVADHVHAKGMKLVVWFEPERVHPGTWLAEKHPEWVLGGSAGGLLNLGNPEAREWLTDHIDGLLTSQGIDLYRQDFNMDPLGYWRANDAPDRQGITEIRHVEGYLAFWDELRRRHPDLLIDTCASGGRRNDLETLRRAVPLLRSDYRTEPHGTQGHTYGMASWIPYHGTGVPDAGDYIVRTHWCPCLGIGRSEPRRAGLDWTEYHRMVAEWRKAAPYLLGDYYPLTPYSLEPGVWAAWQFDRPDLGEGMVQAFRREGSIYESARLRLHGLDSASEYALTDLDSGATRRASGRELLESGLLVEARDRPCARVIFYARLR